MFVCVCLCMYVCVSVVFFVFFFVCVFNQLCRTFRNLNASNWSLHSKTNFNLFHFQGGSTSDDGLLDPEIKLRSDRRRISLMSLLDENQSVISNIAEKRRKKLGQQQTLSIDEDLESIKSDSSDVIKLSLIKEDDVFADLDVTPTAATGAVPKNRATVILPSIVVPPSSGSQRGRLGKARSVSPSSSAAKERLQLNVKRQSSVPLRFEDSELNRTIINESNKLFVTTTSINNNNNHLQHQTGENGDRERKVRCLQWCFFI